MFQSFFHTVVEYGPEKRCWYEKRESPQIFFLPFHHPSFSFPAGNFALKMVRPRAKQGKEEKGNFKEIQFESWDKG